MRKSSRREELDARNYIDWQSTDEWHSDFVRLRELFMRNNDVELPTRYQTMADLHLPCDAWKKPPGEGDEFGTRLKRTLQSLFAKPSRFLYFEFEIAPLPMYSKQFAFNHVNAVIIDRQLHYGMYIDPCGFFNDEARDYERRLTCLNALLKPYDVKLTFMWGDPQGRRVPRNVPSASLWYDKLIKYGYGPQMIEKLEEDSGGVLVHEGHCAAWVVLCAERFIEHSLTGRHYTEFGWRNIVSRRDIRYPFSTEIRFYVYSLLSHMG